MVIRTTGQYPWHLYWLYATRAQASTAITEHLAQKLKRESEAITGYEQNRDEESDEESYEAIQEVRSQLYHAILEYTWYSY